MRRPLLLAALATLAIRVLIVAKLPAPPAWQGVHYARLAEHLAAGQGFVLSTPTGLRPTAFFAPGYPLALAALISPLGSAARAAHALNLASAALAAMCAAALGYRIAGSRGGYFAGLSYALAPGAALWSAATMPETLVGALLVGAVAAALKPVLSTRARIGWSAAAGLLVGAAALTRPYLLLAAPFIGALPPSTRGTRALAATACVLGALALVLPWTARNCAAVGGCSLIASGSGDELIDSVAPRDAGPVLAAHARALCRTASNETARDRCLTRVAARYVARHPVQWVAHGAVKALRAVMYEQAAVNYLRAAIPGTFGADAGARASLIASAWWWAVVATAIVGGRRAARAGGGPRALAHTALLTALLFVLASAIFAGANEDHLALLPLLTPLSAGMLLPPRPRPEPELVWAG